MTTSASVPRIRARIDPSLAVGSSSGSGTSSSSGAQLPRPASSAGTAPGTTTTTRPRLRSAVSSASNISGISSTSGASSTSGTAGGITNAGQGSARVQVNARPLSPSRRGATSPGVFGNGSNVGVGARARLTTTPASSYGTSSTAGRDVTGRDEETPTRIKARVTKSGTNTPRNGADTGAGANAGLGGVAGSGSGSGQGAGPSGRSSPLPSTGRARVRATPTNLLATRALRPQSPTPATGPATPTDARLRAVMTASPSVPAVSSPLSPHVASTSPLQKATEGGSNSGRVSPRGDRPLLALPLAHVSDDRSESRGRFDSDKAEVGGAGGTEARADPLTPLQQPNPPSSIPLALADHAYTSISAPTSPLITASASASNSGRPTRVSRDGDTHAYARHHSQTPTLQRHQPRSHPLRSGTISGPHGARTGPAGGSSTTLGGAYGRVSGSGRRGPATPKSPEVHCIDLPPLTPSTSRPCYDGIETPRYPHLERDRSPLGNATAGEGGEGVMLGYGGGRGTGDDGGLGLAIMQGLQDVEVSRIGDGERNGDRSGQEEIGDGYGRVDRRDNEQHGTGREHVSDRDQVGDITMETREAGRVGSGSFRRSYNDRLSGSTLVDDQSASLLDGSPNGDKARDQHLHAKGRLDGANGYGNGDGHGHGYAQRNGLEIIDIPVARAESESVGTPNRAEGDEVEGDDGEDEDDVLEARINRKVRFHQPRSLCCMSRKTSKEGGGGGQEQQV